MDNVTAFEAFWKSTMDSKLSFNANHAHGAGKTSYSVQDFASSAYNILHNMSPILDIIKDLGSPYGSLAIRVISLFLVNRAETEKQIEGTMRAIRDRLPGLKLYRHIYND
ncbi:hypothetical protein F4779DRAFT_570740 [Xylariaceae sp. FL0662B]|nr:hypothetical protein F4779DRAFT_570740 [Xylariaceae sp. FL0662B]